MKKRIKNVMLLSLVAIIGVILGGCKKETAPQTEITLIHGWGSVESDHEAMRQIYQDFEKENTDIKLNLISMPSSEDVITQVEDMLTIGEIPDIVFTGGVGVDSVYKFMVSNETAIDLMPYLKDDEEFANNISDATKNYWTTDAGQLYTVSDVLLLSGYWYNQDIFRAAGVVDAPGTWNEFLSACQKIDQWAAQEENDVVPILMDSEHILYLTDAILAEESDIFLSVQKSGFLTGSDQLTNELHLLSEIQKYSLDVENYTYRDTLEAFNAGHSAIYINGVWANTMIHSDLNVKYAAFPSENGKSISCISSCLGYVLGDSKDEERIQASIRFLKYMLSEAVQKRIIEETGQIPANPNIMISEVVENPRLLQAVECVYGADMIIETPANIWKTPIKEYYVLYVEDYFEQCKNNP